MSAKKLPEWYLSIKVKHEKYIDALDELGKVIKQEGPLEEKTAHLIQLAAATAIRSEGAVHSHARRALEAGADTEGDLSCNYSSHKYGRISRPHMSHGLASNIFFR